MLNLRLSNYDMEVKGDFKKELKKACKENDIVNVSLGDDIEVDNYDDTLNFGSFIEDARKSGKCIIVKSMENRNVKIKFPNDPSNNLYRVGYSNDFGDTGTASSEAPFYYFGENMPRLNMFDTKCSIYGYDQGTSMAAPNVTTILGKLISKYKAYKKIKKLSDIKSYHRNVSERYLLHKLLKKIIRSSTYFGPHAGRNMINPAMAMAILDDILVNSNGKKYQV